MNLLTNVAKSQIKPSISNSFGGGHVTPTTPQPGCKLEACKRRRRCLRHDYGEPKVPLRSAKLTPSPGPPKSAEQSTSWKSAMRGEI